MIPIDGINIGLVRCGAKSGVSGRNVFAVPHAVPKAICEEISCYAHCPRSDPRVPS